MSGKVQIEGGRVQIEGQDVTRFLRDVDVTPWQRRLVRHVVAGGRVDVEFRTRIGARAADEYANALWELIRAQRAADRLAKRARLRQLHTAYRRKRGRR